MKTLLTGAARVGFEWLDGHAFLVERWILDLQGPPEGTPTTAETDRTPRLFGSAHAGRCGNFRKVLVEGQVDHREVNHQSTTMDSPAAAYRCGDGAVR